MKRFLLLTLAIPGLLILSTRTYAAAFQLFEQDGASPGSYHAGYAAEAEDASIAFYNPAGITRIKNQQAVFAALAVATSLKYKGTVNVTTYSNNATNTVTGQGGTFNFIPALHYVAPINDWIGFGFSVDVPFGAKTTYGQSTFLRYASIETGLTVIDISPSLAFKLNDKASIGFGFDVQRMHAEFYTMGVLGDTMTDSLSTNKFTDTGYGYHAGILYEFNNQTRAGLSYHSQVVHHLSGTSYFEGPLPNEIIGGPISSHSSTRITLPPYTALSVFHLVKPNWALMGSVIYTQWNGFRSLILNSLSGIQNVEIVQNLQLYIPENFRNTLNLSVGTNYYASDKMMVRAGLGYDQTPVVNAYRNVALPDNDRFVMALGGHYQASKNIGLDFSWLHVFFAQANINPPSQVMGDQVVTTNGHVNGGADLYAAQLTWDIF